MRSPARLVRAWRPVGLVILATLFLVQAPARANTITSQLGELDAPATPAQGVQTYYSPIPREHFHINWSGGACCAGREIFYFNEVGFQQFDASLGQLTSATIDTFFAFAVVTDIYMTDPSVEVGAGYFSVSLLHQLWLEAPTYYGTPEPIFNDSPTISGSDNRYETCLARPCSYSFDLRAMGQRLFTDNLDQFIGPAFFSAFYSSEVSIVGGSGFKGDLGDPIAMGFKLTYEYTPIPEPSTVILLGLGLTGLAAKGRRRNRS